jgi:hypothetical protein
MRPRTLQSGTRLSGATIAADGQVFHKDGLFVFDGWPSPA